ncbi:hypothetical protein B0A52_00291 [Exophiala mesophila]|uniref:Cupin type-2 domain-containing protein n=1 Tax=Exophiala mesophila TaxID=212818 RepID=A0A438NJL9_EXOME|nr:hypothetical protein B0A52_00291 [Exophiala mesophila]
MGSIQPPSDDGQVSPLPPIRRYITDHDSKTGQSILLPQEPYQWKSSAAKDAAAVVAYATTEFPPKLGNGEDLRKYKETVTNGKLGLTTPSGTVCRVVDFGPGRKPIMHRTKSLDYGVVLEGSIDMVLDSGQRCTLQRGDIVVQRATMHGWENASSVEWARMMFVLQDCEQFVVGEQEIAEDVSDTKGSFLSS